MTDTILSRFSAYQIPLHGVRLPSFVIPQEDRDKLKLDSNASNFEFLRSLCLAGFKKLKLKKDSLEYKAYAERANYELTTLNELGFVDYILLVWVVLNFCKKKGIPTGLGRGSAAGSLVLFLIGVTGIDPIKYGLYFERFISKTRAKKKVVDGITYLDGSLMCDVDIDICYYRRNEVLEYLNTLFAGKVSKILTLNTLSGKLLIKECGKIISNKSETEMNSVAALIPKIFGNVEDIEVAYKDVKEFQEWCDENREVYEVALSLRDLIKNKSVHASGVMLSYDDLSKSCPVEKTTNDEYVSGYDMKWASLMNVKLDCLGLRAVSVVADACKSIGITMADIDVNDPLIYQNLYDLKCPHGIFQIEAHTAFKSLQKIKPKNIEELSAVLAIARPGALQFLDEYANYTNNGTYKTVHPFFDDIFGKTGGQCLSEDTDLIDIKTGNLFKIKDAKVGQKVQCYNEDTLEHSEGEIVKVFNNGVKETYMLNLFNGIELRATNEHKFLTESGWKELKNLKSGDFIAVPNKIISQNNVYDLNKLRVLAYLISEGSLTSGVSCDFVSKNNELINEYCECLTKGFKNTHFVIRKQIRDVSRISPKTINKQKYHEPNELLTWLREIGLKYKSGGADSTNKFIPNFIFTLKEEQISWFLASLMDCDGGISKYSWYYKTISKQLAVDISTLFLKIGINTWIYKNEYKSVRGNRTAYSIHIRNTKQAIKLISPYLIRLKEKAEKYSNKLSGNNINRRILVNHIDKKFGYSQLSREKIYKLMGKKDRAISLKSSLDKRLNTERASKYINKLDLKEYEKFLNVQWVEIRSIDFFGSENVYDLEIHPHHNYVANNIIVHNCLYQEQLIAAIRKIGFSPEDGEIVRRCVGKKDHKGMAEWEIKIKDKVAENKLDPQIFDIIWKIAQDSASYSFNKCLSPDTVVETENGNKLLYEINIGDRVLAYNTDAQTNHFVEVKNIHTNEVELFEVEMEDGRIIKCSIDHKFLCNDNKMHTLKQIIENNLEIVCKNA